MKWIPKNFPIGLYFLFALLSILTHDPFWVELDFLMLIWEVLMAFVHPEGTFRQIRQKQKALNSDPNSPKCNKWVPNPNSSTVPQAMMECGKSAYEGNRCLRHLPR